MAEIQFKGITKRYPDGFEAVKSIDLDINDGEFMILVGPSGCGKSTALRMIAGLEDITDGDLIIGGERVNDLRAFQGFIAEQLANGGAELTLEEALGLWEYENQTGQEREATLQAIRQGLADLDAGRTRPAADVLRDLCRKYQLVDPTR